MKMIQIFIEGSGWHELPADTPPDKINEYVVSVQEMVAAFSPPKLTNGHATRPEVMTAMQFLAGM